MVNFATDKLFFTLGILKDRLGKLCSEDEYNEEIETLRNYADEIKQGYIEIQRLIRENEILQENVDKLAAETKELRQQVETQLQANGQGGELL